MRSLGRAGWGRASLLICLTGSVALCPLEAKATPPLQKQAQELGFAAADCAYCHTFDMAHMRKKARDMGIATMNCATCHGKKLPKTGRDLFNDRGKWLLDEKVRRSAKAFDMAWLREFPVKDAKGAK